MEKTEKGGSVEKGAKILVVDDDEQIRRALKSILSVRGCRVSTAGGGALGLNLAIENTPDLVVLDVSLPDMSGIEVCEELRAWYAGPVIMLSIRSEESDKIRALDSGADDYMTKPFSAGELLARIRAQLRRAAPGSSVVREYETGALKIDIAQRRVTFAGREVDLTPTEFDILALLAKNMNCVITSRMILESVWGEDCAQDTQALRVHVSHLRKKIEPDSVPRYILTEPQVGFILAGLPKEPPVAKGAASSPPL